MFKSHSCSGSTSGGPGRRLERGFTLVELMITIVVLGVVLAIGIPSFRGITNHNRIVAASNEITGALQLARSEAIRRNRRVELCPTTNGTGCGGSDWSRMIIRVANGGEVVRQVQIIGAGLSFSESGNVDSLIGFAPSGFARIGTSTPAATSGSLSVCSQYLPVAENTRDISIVASRISVSTRDGTAACEAAED